MRTIKEIAIIERPYERCLEYGVENLTLSELIAILLGSGNNQKNVLDLAQSICRDLVNADKKNHYNFNLLTSDFLCNFRGVGKVKACRIMAGIELGRRIALYEPPSELPILNRPDLVAKELNFALSGLDHEEVYAIFLNIKMRMISKQKVATGSIASCKVDPRKIYKLALHFNAAGIILAHNHPSGDLTPSNADLNITKHYYNLGKNLEIPLHDHLIIGNNRFLSLREKFPEIFS